jgi:hypothetical protein
MKLLITIALMVSVAYCHAQYTGGTGGGGATNCSAAFQILPVELLHFTATAKGHEVQLQWATASELNNAGFHVERSSDGERFESIAQVEGMGTSNTMTQYEAIDSAPLPGLSYYRLRQTDLDGATTVSAVVPVVMSAGRWVAYPNPANSVITLSGGTDTGTARAEVYDVQGRRVLQNAFPGGAFTFDLTALPAGLYHVLVSGAYGAESLQFVKE